MFDKSPQATRVISAIRELITSTESPVILAIDGGSGAGKSTIAELIGNEFDAAVIPLDDFYSADIPDPAWRDFSVEERFQRVFRWNAVRREVLKPLKEGQRATWFAFDFDSGMRPDGTYGIEKEAKIYEATDVVILEGVYSASPQLADLVDFSILIDVPVHERHDRLDGRQDAEFSKSWREVWDEVEAYYFGSVRPKGSFDLVVRG